MSVLGLRFDGKYVSLISSQNKNVNKGCTTLNACPAANKCGKYGECQSIFGSHECNCKPGYHGSRMY